MKKIILSLTVASMLLACCTSKKATETAGSATEDTTSEVVADSLINRPLLGGDRDEHGCIPSAGYVWCEKLGKCIRPWEEKCE